MRLGVLYPPCGAEAEYYIHGEALGADVRMALVGVRIFGGDDEHAVGHMRRTGTIDNLLLSADALAATRPDAVAWACTSGSFVDGLGHARRQVQALREVLDCPATSTSLAFLAALEHLGIERVSVLASYPGGMAAAFEAFLAGGGVEVDSIACLDIDSGPAAARIGDARLLDRVARMRVAEGGAVLIPDTAIPTLHLLPQLAAAQSAPVLTANQVTLWHLARLVGREPDADVAGVLATPALQRDGTA